MAARLCDSAMKRSLGGRVWLRSDAAISSARRSETFAAIMHWDEKRGRDPDAFVTFSESEILALVPEKQKGPTVVRHRMDSVRAIRDETRALGVVTPRGGVGSEVSPPRTENNREPVAGCVRA